MLTMRPSSTATTGALGGATSFESCEGDAGAFASASARAALTAGAGAGMDPGKPAGTAWPVALEELLAAETPAPDGTPSPAEPAAPGPPSLAEPPLAGAPSLKEPLPAEPVVDGPAASRAP